MKYAVDVNDEKMTPNERMDAYLNNKSVDRLPFSAMMSEDAVTYMGRTFPEYLFNSDVMVETELFKINKLKFESASISLGLRGIGECLGSEFEYPANRTPHVSKPILKDYSDLDKLEPINPKKDGRCPIILEGLSKTKEIVKDFCSVGCSVPGPISAAHAVRGEIQILKDVIKHPEEFEHLMDFMVLNCLIFARENFLRNDIVCSIADPMSSTVLINPKLFEKRVFPYLEKLVDGIYELTDVKPAIHICGRTKPIWPLLKKLNISTFSIDNLESVKEATKFFGDKISIIGNVDPVGVVANGNRAQIIDEVLECIKDGADCPKGFIPGTGCDIPSTAPISNILALNEAVKIHGKKM